MNIINIFLASSIEEFEIERIFIGNFIRILNSENKHCHIKLFLCEDAKINMQSVYDREIEGCSIFIALVGAKLGPYTKHELYVAHASTTIQQRIIFLQNQTSYSFIPSDIEHDFEIIISNEDILTTVYHYLENAICQIKPVVKESEYIDTTNHASFIINLPILGKSSVEEATIGNVVRFLNDQYEHKIDIYIDDCHDRDSCDAYMVIISGRDNNDDERLTRISDLSVANEKKWICVNKEQSNLSEYCKGLLLSLANKDGVYPSIYFRSHRDLASEFKDVFRSILIDYNILEGFTYTVEDHILKRVSFYSGAKFVVKNLSELNLDEERQARKERIIQNILNSYCLTRDFYKLNRALSAINHSDFGYFVYDTPPDYAIVGENPYTIYIDYIIDSIENLLLQCDSGSTDEIIDKLSAIIKNIDSSDYRLRPIDKFKVNYMCGCLRLLCGKHDDLAYTYFEQCISDYDKIPTNDINDTIFEFLKQCYLEICHLNFIKNDYDSLSKFATKGIEIINNGNYNNEMAEALLYTYVARSLLNKDRNVASQRYNAAADKCEKLLHKDNYSLNLYIEIKCEYIINELLRNSNADYCDVIDDLCNKYKKYLSSVSECYKSTKYYLMLLKSIRTNDLKLCNEAIDNFTKIIDPKSHPYYDILYIKSSILENNKMYNEAIALLDDLTESYSGLVDKALCLQNIALNYMNESLQPDNLSNAELAFQKALSFLKEQDYKDVNEFIGNIYDGLSYCYILKKEYQNAFDYSIKSINIPEYKSCNKLCNYISVLLCQKKFLKAWYIYKMAGPNKYLIRNRLKDDWKDMQSVGINTSWFKLIFI